MRLVRASSGKSYVMSIHRIDIEATTIRGERGQYYRVYFEGAVLLDETWNPEFEGCRALVARGITGRMEVWRAGKAHADMLVPDIAEAARWTVVENDKEGPVIKRWEPMPEDLQRKAVSRREIPPAAKSVPGVA
jgi:hypothetical protein